MKKDPKIFLEHILESIRNIEKYTESFTKKQFLKNLQLQDAVTRICQKISKTKTMKSLGEKFRAQGIF